MKNYVSVNSKYYKHTSHSGVLGHVDRLLRNDPSIAFPEKTKFNFGTTNNTQRYRKIHKKNMDKESKKHIKPRIKTPRRPFSRPDSESTRKIGLVFINQMYF